LVRAKELCYSKTANRESVFAQAVFLASGKDPVEPGVRSNNGSSSVSGSSSGETAKAAALPPPPPPSRRSAPGLPLIPPLPPPIKEPVSTYAPVPGLEGDSEEEEAKEGDVASGGGGGEWHSSVVAEGGCTTITDELGPSRGSGNDDDGTGALGASVSAEAREAMVGGGKTRLAKSR
jgi:hypothetical protein